MSSLSVFLEVQPQIVFLIVLSFFGAFPDISGIFTVYLNAMLCKTLAVLVHLKCQISKIAL